MRLLKTLLLISTIVGLSSCKLFKGKDCDCPHWSQVNVEEKVVVSDNA